VFPSCSGFDWREDSDGEIDRLVEAMCRCLIFTYFHNCSLEVLCNIAETLSEESVCDSRFKRGTPRIRKNANHSSPSTNWANVIVL
jgi:hypothetical protein